MNKLKTDSSQITTDEISSLNTEASSLFIFFFRYYVKLLFYRRFNKVWLDQNYHPDENKSTVYYLNHNSWWDGIIPLLLNEFRFGQRAGAIMDEVQLKKYPFFRKIGAYAIDRGNPRKAIKTLQWTADYLSQKGTCVFIYPQGSLTDPRQPISFESGLCWIYDHCREVDFVPIALHQNTYHSDKPTLHIKTGVPAAIDPALPRHKKISLLEQSLKELLTEVREAAFDEEPDLDLLV